MVRLKGSNELSIVGNTAFQFQYGTIKSSLRVRGYHKIIKFQFQYGTIKSLLETSFNKVTLVSIPIWYD